MGYYCTVPQCTSLAGKTKNVKFHRFPRDETLANRWNDILHRNKPFTKYSKVCSLHFTHNDYNVTTMGKKTGQWKTLSKDAIPSQNLPKLNPDGTVMVIRKSRSLKYKPEGSQTPSVKKEEDSISEKRGDWTNTSGSSYSSSPGSSSVNTSLNTSLIMSDSIQHRLSALNSMATAVSPQLRTVLQQAPKPIKLDAIMQTDPLDISKHSEENPSTPPEDREKESIKDEFQFEVFSHNKPPERPKECEKDDYRYVESYSHNSPPKNYSKDTRDYNGKSPYAKSPSYTPEPVENYNKQDYKVPEYKIPESYKLQEYSKPSENNDLFDKNSNESYENRDGSYENREAAYEYPKPQEYFQQNPADVLRNQQHNLQMLQEQMSSGRMAEDARFYSGRIKEEIDLSNEDAMVYDANNTQKDDGYASQQLLQQQQRRMDFYERRQPIKSEPDLTRGCDSVMQPQPSPLPTYYRTDQHADPRANGIAYYSQQCDGQPQPLTQHQQFSRQPGAEILIAKQNALAAQTSLWQNSMKRPFYYSEAPHAQFNSQLHSRYEDLTRLLNQ